MRKPSSSSKGLVLASLAAAVGGALIATAQPEPEAPPPTAPPPRAFRAGGGPMAEAPGLGPQVVRVLTEEQRASWREIMQAQQEKTRQLMEKIRDARKAILEASLAEPFDESAIRKQAEVIGKAEADLAVLRAKALAEIKPPLTAEQREKLKNPPALEPGAGRGVRPLRGPGGAGGPPPTQPAPAQPPSE
jgi:Spy/CpxP family protein refolding chaperone